MKIFLLAVRSSSFFQPSSKKPYDLEFYTAMNHYRTRQPVYGSQLKKCPLKAPLKIKNMVVLCF